MDKEALYAAYIKAIKQRMEELGMSQKELARIVGVSEAAISRHLNGKRVMSADTFLAIIYATKEEQ